METTTTQRASDTDDLPSPCIGVCRLDPVTDMCEGCLRTLDEIGEWGDATPARKMEILGLLRTRRRAAGRTSAADSKPRRRQR